MELDDDGGFTTPGGLVVPALALTWRYSRSGGAGGQHVNTSDTRVELLCDISACGWHPAIEARITESLTGAVRCVSSRSRSQWRNRVAAGERLAGLLDAAATPATPRRATRPSRGAREARLADKRQTGERKAARAWKSED